MKKFINDVEQVENEMIDGLVKAYPNYLRKLDDNLVLVRKRQKSKVALVAWWKWS